MLLATMLWSGAVGEARAQVAFNLGGVQVDDVRGLAIDAAGNTYMIGRFRQTVDFDPGPGVFSLTTPSGYATFIASYDAAGALRYAFDIGSASNAPERDIAVDAAGNIYVTGVFSGTPDFDPGSGSEVLSSVDGNIFVASYDASGDFRFAFNLGVTSVVGEIAAGIAVDASGTSYITGEFTGETDFDPSGGETLLEAEGVSDVFVASYTTGGNLRFAIGMGSTERDRGLDIAIDAAGNSYVSGAFRGSVDFDPGLGTAIWTSAGNEDVFLASYDDDGNHRFSVRAGGTLTDLGRGVAVDANGNAFVAGSFQDVIDFDPGPGTWGATSAGNQDLFLASYDDTGALRFAFGLGNTNDDFGSAVAVDAAGDVAITGSFVNAVDFDPGPGTAVLSESGTKALVARYSNTGGYQDAYAFEVVGSGDAAGQDIALDPSGRPAVIGDFSGTIDFDPGADVLAIASNGSSDAFFSSFTPAAPVPLWSPLGLGCCLGLVGWRAGRRARS